MKSKALFTMLVFLLGSITAMTAQSFVVFDIPNSGSDIPNGVGMVVTGINAHGDGAGYFQDASQGYKQRGFVRDRNGNIKVIDAPNASATSIRSINAGGAVAGYFAEEGKVRGFVQDVQGIITVFDASSLSVTDVESISDSGEVAGMTFGSSSPIHGFVRDENGAITVFDVPNSAATYVTGANARGDVIGYFFDPTRGFTPVGFVRDNRGQFALFDEELAFAINARGEITGSFSGSSQSGGFIAEVNGTIVFFDGFDASGRNINARGDVVGYLFDQSLNKVRGFERHMNGDVTIFDAPSASDTRAVSINARGDIAGYFADSSQGNKTRGFVRVTR
jgi:hypothetical protein